MKTNTVKNAEGHVFKNGKLELLSKAPPSVSASLYLFLVVLLLSIAIVKGQNSLGGNLLIFFTAVCFWTLFEYLAHRYFFHIDHYFPRSGIARRIAFIFHGIHHEHPRDTHRLLMPPVPGFLIIGILYTIGLIILGIRVYAFLAGFLTGYLLYTYVHYKSHVAPVPPFLKSQYRHHALHHFKYPDKAFGVSSPFWDWVFGTLPPKSEETQV